MNIQEDMKKILLAGLGAVAVTAEKSKELVGELVKKGELTVEQGKVLNEELRRNISKKDSEVSENKDELKEKLASMTPEELEALKAQIAQMEKQRHASSEE